MIGKYVVVRSNRAGVFAGVLAAEVIPTTAEAEASIKAVPVWKM